MKENFLKHKKKIIISILMVASLLFPPVRALIPGAEILLPADEVAVEQK